MKRIVKTVVAEISPYNFDNDLKSVRDYIDTLIAEHGENAILNFDASYHAPYDPDPSPQFELYIHREETDDEHAMRQNSEAQAAEYELQRQKQEYEKLKKIFEDNNK